MARQEGDRSSSRYRYRQFFDQQSGRPVLTSISFDPTADDWKASAAKNAKEQIIGKRTRPKDGRKTRPIMMNNQTHFVYDDDDNDDDDLVEYQYQNFKRSRKSYGRDVASPLGGGTAAKPINLTEDFAEKTMGDLNGQYITIDDRDDERATTPLYESEGDVESETYKTACETVCEAPLASEWEVQDGTPFGGIVGDEEYSENTWNEDRISVIHTHEQIHRDQTSRRQTIHGTLMPARARVHENMDTFPERYRKPQGHKNSEGEMDTLPCRSWDELPFTLFRDEEAQCDRRIDLVNHRDVELTGGSFFRITMIVGNDRTGDVWIKGRKMIRSKSMAPVIGGLKNQLVWIAEVHRSLTEKLSGKGNGEIWIRPSRIRKLRKIVFSNLPTENWQRADDHEFNANAVLRCSWKFFSLYEHDTKHRRVFSEMCVLRMMACEADEGHCEGDSVVQEKFRRLGRQHIEQPGRYTFADGFCCSGGATTGALAAGAVFDRAFDKDPAACASYERNFGEGICFVADTHKYCDLVRELGLPPVAIAHYSPCCKTWSAAHTHIGKDDEANEATLLALSELLMVDRPRITTLENTSGLWTHQPDWMYGMLGQYTSLDFSVRFAVKNLGQYGVPQKRKRFLIIGACPGEPLPPFPIETHSLSECVTLGQAVEKIELLHNLGFEIPDHTPAESTGVYDDKIYSEVAKSITTSASENWHYNGRQLTVRELAIIQTFPIKHLFGEGISKTAKKSQIGNAFPPYFTWQMLHQVVQSLRRADGLPASNLPFDHNAARHTLKHKWTSEKVDIVHGSPFKIVENKDSPRVRGVPYDHHLLPRALGNTTEDEGEVAGRAPSKDANNEVFILD